MKNFLSFVLTPLILLVSLTSLQAQDEEFGLASYYSDEFHGRKTAYGDTYDKEKLTTAHKKHPYGTILKVTRLDNNKSVTVKVIDKGPFIRGRVVDLSRKAAEKIDLTDVGVAEVKVEVVSKVSKETAPEAIVSTPKTIIPKERPTGFSDESTTATKIAANTSAAAPEKETVNPSKETKPKAKEKEILTAKGGEPSSTSGASSSAPAAKPRLVGQDYTKYGLYKIVLEKPSKTGFGVQVASLSNYENVLRQVADLQAKWFDNILLSVEKGTDNPIYKIILGPFDSESQAENYKKDMAKKHKVKGFVISLDEIKY
ncbi:MAG: septal ring lytic transglycosylase RlpA family protein [Saprospiraceae bacterium]